MLALALILTDRSRPAFGSCLVRCIIMPNLSARRMPLGCRSHGVTNGAVILSEKGGMYVWLSGSVPYRRPIAKSDWRLLSLKLWWPLKA